MTKPEETPLPFCFTCNKVIKVDPVDVMFHLKHKTGTKTWKQIYNQAINQQDTYRKPKNKIVKKKDVRQIRGW